MSHTHNADHECYECRVVNRELAEMREYREFALRLRIKANRNGLCFCERCGRLARPVGPAPSAVTRFGGGHILERVTLSCGHVAPKPFNVLEVKRGP